MRRGEGREGGMKNGREGRNERERDGGIQSCASKGRKEG